MEQTNETERVLTPSQEYSKKVYGRLVLDLERMRVYKTVQKANCVNKYKTDEEFREKLKARNKAYYYRKKAENAKIRDEWNKMTEELRAKYATSIPN